MLLFVLLVLTQSTDIETFGDFELAYEADYVGSARCGACHGELTEQQRHL